MVALVLKTIYFEFRGLKGGTLETSYMAQHARDLMYGIASKPVDCFYVLFSTTKSYLLYVCRKMFISGGVQMSRPS